METTCPSDERVSDPGRWELVRAVGAITLLAPPAGDRLSATLGIRPFCSPEHTELFVLSLPPYEGIHLGPEGKLGGEGTDRACGLWRALDLDPPSDADHLGSLLALYAELGEAADHTGSDRSRQRLDHIRAALLWEHLWPWVPSYLDAAAEEHASAGPWASLVRRVLEREARLTPGASVLPLALRAAPQALAEDAGYEELLDALTAPVRTGFVLTYRDLGVAARRLGLGLRRGERRFALKAMLEQDPTATFTWLRDHARRWAALHRERPAVPADPAPWWERRALDSAEVFATLARRSAEMMLP
ncbi:MAG: molecular chaperone TorD family protein [Acidimicrobiales bacterium]